MDKKRKLLILAGCVALAAGCAQPNELALDSFEGELDHSTVDYGAGGGAALEIFADRDQKVDGEQSIRLEYDLAGGGYLWTARGYGLDVGGAAKWSRPPQKIDWSKFRAFSVQMLGKNSGGKVAFDIKDSGNEMWRFVIDDDSTGWKEIVMPFAGFFVRSDWQPHNADKNGKIDFPVKSFQFEPRRPDKGAYTFDQVRLLK